MQNLLRSSPGSLGEKCTRKWPCPGTRSTSTQTSQSFPSSLTTCQNRNSAGTTKGDKIAGPWDREHHTEEKGIWDLREALPQERKHLKVIRGSTARRMGKYTNLFWSNLPLTSTHHHGIPLTWRRPPFILTFSPGPCHLAWYLSESTHCAHTFAPGHLTTVRAP